MIEVPNAEFFAALKADKRDIMPSIVSKWSDTDGYVSEWRTNDSRRELFGRSWGISGREVWQLLRATPDPSLTQSTENQP